MSLTDRHRWIIGKILEAFAPELDSETVNAFVRQDSIVQRFTSFFRGEGPQQRLFVFFQSESSNQVTIDIYFYLLPNCMVFDFAGDKIFFIKLCFCPFIPNLVASKLSIFHLKYCILHFLVMDRKSRTESFITLRW